MYVDGAPGKRAGFVLAGLLLLTAAAAGWLAWAAPHAWPAGVWVWLAVGLAALVPLVGWGAQQMGRLRYAVVDGHLLAAVGERERRVRLADLGRVRPGASFSHLRRFRGVRWPGCFIGRGELVDDDGHVRPVVVTATRPLSEQTIVETPHGWWAFSPADSASFERQLTLDRGAVTRPARSGETVLRRPTGASSKTAVWGWLTVGYLCLGGCWLGWSVFGFDSLLPLFATAVWLVDGGLAAVWDDDTAAVTAARFAALVPAVALLPIFLLIGGG